MSVEFTWRLGLFFAVVWALQGALDAIVLPVWSRLVRRKGWHRFWYVVPAVIGCFMLCVMPLTLYLRQMEMHPGMLNKFLHQMLALWYVPKIPVAVGIVSLAIMRRFDDVFTARIVDVLERAWRGALVLSMRGLEWFSKSVRRFSPISAHPLIIVAVEDIASPSRRAFLERSVKIGAYGLAAAPVLAVGADAVFTLYDFQVHRVRVRVRNLPRQFDGFRIAQLSDIHAGSLYSPKPMQEARRIAESLKPDVFMITGDWVNWRASELPLILPEIQQLCAFANTHSRFGVWGCLGNHDHYSSGAEHQEILAAVRSAGVNLLVNQNTTFAVDGARLQLAGMDNVGLRQRYGNLEQTLTGLLPEHPTILMAHDPTFWDAHVNGKHIYDFTIDLTLAGHTHGGQIGVNILGLEISPAALMYRQFAGLYEGDNSLGQHIYVNRGIGTTGIPLRLGIPPEITLLTLTRA
jgi:uncharacterized protein